MKRTWVPISSIEAFDDFHFKAANKYGFDVNVEKDGQTLEQHMEGIEYIKSVISAGQKVRPILIAEDGFGTYERLDGFKRLMAHTQLGEKFIEAFVCTPQERRGETEYPYENYKIRCGKGGQPKEYFGLFENGAMEQHDYEKITFLYKSPNPAGLRIEFDESIHVHWGEYGRYRLTLGRKDFEALAEAIAQI